MLEEVIDIPYLVFGSMPTPINYHEMVLEALLIITLALSMLTLYHKELNKRIECNREMHARMEREYRLSQSLEMEKEFSSKLLSIGYRYQHECQTPLVTLGGYFESIVESVCEETDCPVIRDRAIIIDNITKLYYVNKNMSDELNNLCQSRNENATKGR